MDAAPLLCLLARAMREHNLEAVLIGNAAAALNGAPVTTLDFDFLFRQTAGNLKKLAAIAQTLATRVTRPYYPASGLFRIERADLSLQVDFMAAIHGVKSFASLRSRARWMDVGGCQVLVADLGDIIKSKRKADRPRDRAVLEILERTLNAQKKNLEEGKT